MRLVVGGRNWRGLQPHSVARSGDPVIFVKLFVVPGFAELEGARVVEVGCDPSLLALPLLFEQSGPVIVVYWVRWTKRTKIVLRVKFVDI